MTPDKKAVELYKSIHAPETLKARVMRREAKKRPSMPKFPLVAACLLLVAVAAFAALGPFGSFTVSVGDSPATASKSRAATAELAPVEIPLIVESSGDVTICVDRGSILLEGEDRGAECAVPKDAEVTWLLPSGDATLTLRRGLRAAQYRLTLGDAGNWNLEKIK